MRHRVSGKKLNRDSGHRRALFKNLARSFFRNGGKMKTTLTKAKAVQGLIEKMISKAGKGDLASRRWLFKYFQDQHVVNQIVASFGKQFAKRTGGCTKITRLERRKGDNAIIARLELVEELEKEEEEEGKKKGKKGKRAEKKAEKKEKGKKKRKEKEVKGKSKKEKK